MDLETENHLAALLMEEARRLRCEADKEGVLAYLRKPNVRGRPNSRFLTATVRGVEQANRAVQISEMWRAREKERELDAKQRPDRNARSTVESRHRGSLSRHGTDRRDSSYCERGNDSPSGDAAFGDDEIEEFLQSRVKRGRGSVGSRMDEPGPYLPSKSTAHDEIEETKRCPLGPEKPSFLKRYGPSEGNVHAEDLANNEHKSEKYASKEKRLKKMSGKRRKDKAHHLQKKKRVSRSG